MTIKLFASFAMLDSSAKQTEFVHFTLDQTRRSFLKHLVLKSEQILCFNLGGKLND